MAAPVLRVVRRPKGALTASVEPAALTAASAPVTNVKDIFKSTGLGGRGNDWQSEAWDLAEVVVEFGFYQRWRAGSCSRVRLVASEIDPDTGMPTGSVAEDNREGQRVVDIVRGIAGGHWGQAQLVKRAVEILSVAGELWVAILEVTEGAGRARRTTQRWFAVTREEIERGTRGDTVVIVLPDRTKHEFDPAKDALFRVWNPHPRRASEPDSPARGVLEPMREIVRTTKKISNADLSRLISAGVLFIPSEASLPGVAGAPVSADKPGAPAPAGQQVKSTHQRLQEQIVEVATTAAREGENSMASLVPLVASAPGAHIDKIKHLTFGEEVSKVALETRTAAISRLAMGLDMAPEQLLGLGSSSNHWNAFLLSDQDVQIYVAPVMQTVCGAIYESVLTNVLDAEGIDAGKYTLWFDTSALTADPDKSDEAQAAYEAGAITAEAYVRALGLEDTALYNLTTREGIQQFARDAVTKNPALLPKFAVLLDPIRDVEFPAAQPAIESSTAPPDDNTDPDREPDTEAAAAGNGDRPTVTASLAGDDGVELAVVDLLVGRALELAGKRRVKTNDREQHARLRGIPARDYYRYMEPVSEIEVGRLIKGYDDAFPDALAAAHGLDAERVRASVRRLARHELTRQVVDGQVM